MTAPASHLAIAAALGVAVFTVATAVPVASAQVLDKEVHIDQFAFAPQRVTVKTGTTVTWINDDDIPHTAASSGKLFKSRALDTKDKFSFTFTTPGTYEYFCSLHPHMTGGDGSDAHQEKARRFRDAALPHLNDAYTLARYLLRDAADAEDAVQECYLRALRYFDTFRGKDIKPWLFAILRNICRGEFARRSRVTHAIDDTTDDAEDAAPFWQEKQASPETEMVRQWDAETIRRLVAELPDPFREAIVLREINDLSYSEIADVVGVPIGTVMSRLARARSMLRKAWIAEEGLPK
jgi:RNA polymerase sigma-70 factor (ECF subfamily)